MWKHSIKGSVLIIFFLTTLSLSVGMSLVNSPDENANKQFATRFAETGRIELIEPLNPKVGGVIGPRSTVAIDDRLVPRSFLGMTVFYGGVGAVTTTSAMVFVTPILALLAIVAWRDLVFRLFKKESLADLAALFLLIHPAFWHYSARTFMHNVPFLALLIFGAWVLVRRPGRWWFHAFIGGAFIGLALAFRTSEIIWVLASVVGLFAITAQKKTDYARLAVVGGGILFALLPFAALNNAVYGGPLTTGYTVETPIDHAAQMYEGAETEQAAFSGLLGILFPFGIHEKAILRHVFQYGFLLYPWLSLLSAVGIGIVLAATYKRWRAKKAWRNDPWSVMVVLTLLLAAWLGVVYGSWSFHDNPDPFVVSVGNSYARYWLPLFTLASVFAAGAVLWLGQLVANERLRKSLMVFVIGSCVFASLHLVFDGSDGFLSTRLALQSFETKKALILDQTDPESVIIVDRADKYLFPDRRVIVPLRDESTYAAMPSLVDHVPLYYFGITFPPEDMAYLNTDKLAGLGLFIYPVLTVQEETLYKIEPVQE